MQPSALRPLLKDACVFKYIAPTTGTHWTSDFTNGTTVAKIAAAIAPAGYTGDPNALDAIFQKALKSGDAPTVAVGSTQLDKDFAHYYPKGLWVQTGVPVNH